jgi:hypothetical protein
MNKIYQLAAGLVPCKDNCTINDFFVLIKKIIDFLVQDIALPVAVVVLIYAGIMILTSGGNEGKKSKGTDALWFAVWGMLITFAAWLIVDTIIKWFVVGGTGAIPNWGPWNQIK